MSHRLWQKKYCFATFRTVLELNLCITHVLAWYHSWDVSNPVMGVAAQNQKPKLTCRYVHVWALGQCVRVCTQWLCANPTCHGLYIVWNICLQTTQMPICHNLNIWLTPRSLVDSTWSDRILRNNYTAECDVYVSNQLHKPHVMFHGPRHQLVLEGTLFQC